MSTPDDVEVERTAVLVHRHGTPAAYTLSPEAMGQVRLAHHLRNALVELHHARQAAIAAVWAQHPHVAAAQTVVATAQTAADDVAARASEERIRDHTRKLRPGTAAAQREARAQLRAAKDQLRAAKDTARDAMMAGFADAADAEREGQKALYVRFCQHGDRDTGETLYWATFNAVVDHHKTAVKKIGADRAAGKPAELRYHRWDGSGTIAVQLQRQAGQPVRDHTILADTERGKWRNVLSVPAAAPGRRRRSQTSERYNPATEAPRHGVVRFCIGSGRMETVPVAWHRDLPPMADVAAAQLTVRRVAGSARTHLTITCKVPQAPLREGGPAVAVHLGWRRDRDGGSLRVATWRADTPIAVPEHLRDVVEVDTDHSGTIVLPTAWRTAMDRVDALRSDRDKHLDVLRADLVAYLRDHPPADDDEDERVPTAARVGKWRSPARFAALAARWRATPPPGAAGADIAARLEEWRRWDRRRWEAEAHGRAKHLARRDDAYRRVAAWLAAHAGQIIIDNTDLRRLARTPAPAEELDVPTAVSDRAAAQRVDAAPSTLRDAITATARREGVTVTTVPAAGVTRTHVACGHTNPADDRWAASAIVLCDGCGMAYDQDRNAVAALIAAGASGPAGPDTPGTARTTP